MIQCCCSVPGCVGSDPIVAVPWAPPQSVGSGLSSRLCCRRYQQVGEQQKQEQADAAAAALQRRKQLRERHDNLMRKPWTRPASPSKPILTKGDGARHRRRAVAQSLEKAAAELQAQNRNGSAWARERRQQQHAPIAEEVEGRPGIRAFIAQQRQHKHTPAAPPHETKLAWRDIKLLAAEDFRAMVGDSDAGCDLQSDHQYALCDDWNQGAATEHPTEVHTELPGGDAFEVTFAKAQAAEPRVSAALAHAVEEPGAVQARLRPASLPRHRAVPQQLDISPMISPSQSPESPPEPAAQCRSVVQADQQPMQHSVSRPAPAMLQSLTSGLSFAALLEPPVATAGSLSQREPVPNSRAGSGRIARDGSSVTVARPELLTSLLGVHCLARAGASDGTPPQAEHTTGFDDSQAVVAGPDKQLEEGAGPKLACRETLESQLSSAIAAVHPVSGGWSQSESATDREHHHSGQQHAEADDGEAWFRRASDAAKSSSSGKPCEVSSQGHQSAGGAVLHTSAVHQWRRLDSDRSIHSSTDQQLHSVQPEPPPDLEAAAGCQSAAGSKLRKSPWHTEAWQAPSGGRRQPTRSLAPVEPPFPVNNTAAGTGSANGSLSFHQGDQRTTSTAQPAAQLMADNGQAKDRAAHARAAGREARRARDQHSQSAGMQHTMASMMADVANLKLLREQLSSEIAAMKAPQRASGVQASKSRPYSAARQPNRAAIRARRESQSPASWTEDYLTSTHDQPAAAQGNPRPLLPAQGDTTTPPPHQQQQQHCAAPPQTEIRTSALPSVTMRCVGARHDLQHNPAVKQPQPSAAAAAHHGKVAGRLHSTGKVPPPLPSPHHLFGCGMHRDGGAQHEVASLPDNVHSRPSSIVPAAQQSRPASHVQQKMPSAHGRGRAASEQPVSGQTSHAAAPAYNRERAGRYSARAVSAAQHAVQEGMSVQPLRQAACSWKVPMHAEAPLQRLGSYAAAAAAPPPPPVARRRTSSAVPPCMPSTDGRDSTRLPQDRGQPRPPRHTAAAATRSRRRVSEPAARLPQPSDGTQAATGNRRARPTCKVPRLRAALPTHKLATCDVHAATSTSGAACCKHLVKEGSYQIAHARAASCKAAAATPHTRRAAASEHPQNSCQAAHQARPPDAHAPLAGGQEPAGSTIRAAGVSEPPRPQPHCLKSSGVPARPPIALSPNSPLSPLSRIPAFRGRSASSRRGAHEATDLDLSASFETEFGQLARDPDVIALVRKQQDSASQRVAQLRRQQGRAVGQGSNAAPLQGDITTGGDGREEQRTDINRADGAHGLLLGRDQNAEQRQARDTTTGHRRSTASANTHTAAQARHHGSCPMFPELALSSWDPMSSCLQWISLPATRLSFS
jgi:hypothetical protein